MIISRTPLRISFFGGGTDYPAYYSVHGGAVLSATIDKFCYLSVRRLPPFFEHKNRIVYRLIETVKTRTEIQHPTVRAVMQFLELDGLEIHHDGDLPARSGMGTSSAFTVGLLNACHALAGERVSRYALESEARHIEQDILCETVGSQDQIAAAHGGLNRIAFSQSGHIGVERVPLPEGRLAEFENHLMLFFTGISRTASDVASTFVPGIASKDLSGIRAQVDEGLEILGRRRSLDAFGDLLHQAWVAKRALSDAVSNPAIDALYARARDAGAIGGKVTGAGGGGFVLFFVRPEKQESVRNALGAEILEVPFRFESQGSRIIVYDP